MKIAVYGTLKRGRGNNRVLGKSEFLGEGTVQGYRMYESGIPFVVKDESSEYLVQVDVFEVPEGTVPHVDRLEGHPDFYERFQVPVQMADGTALEAWMYIVPEAPSYTEENTTGEF